MTQSFDVFLSHNSKDKPAVRELAEALRARGLKVWLDEWELVPGQPWQEALEEIIETTGSSAVLVGKDGLGPWHAAEMRGCLTEFVRRKLPVIPVLLPGAPVEPRLPLFLTQVTWVDLRSGLTEEGLDRLQWGITGKRPGTLSRIDLSELQSFAVAVPLEPPQRRAPLGSPREQVTDHETIAPPPPSPPLSLVPDGSSVSLPPASSTEEQVARVYTRMPPPSHQGPLVVPSRTILAASISSLLLLAVAATLYNWLWRTMPQVGRDAQEDARQKQVVELVRKGSRSLRAGDPTTAATAFRQAEQVAPDKQKPLLHNARLEAEKQVQEFSQLAGRQEMVLEHLSIAQGAMESRHFKEAVAAADAALALDPANPQAQQIRSAAHKEQSRLEQARLQRPQRPADQKKIIATNLTYPDELDRVAEGQTASLNISFVSEILGGTDLSVNVNGENILKQLVTEKSAFFGNNSVAAGETEVQVWVTPQGKVPQLFSCWVYFLGGSSFLLDIRIPSNGQPSVELR